MQENQLLFFSISINNSQQFSITIALAPPPPLQIPAAPSFPLFCLRTFISVTRILAPEHPSGCPSETAPPLTLTRTGSSDISLLFAIDTTENASLISK